MGANVNIDKINTGCQMSSLQRWCGEYQEQCSFLSHLEDYNFIKRLSKRENVPISIFGVTNNTGVINLIDND